MNHGERHAGCRYHDLSHYRATRKHVRNWFIAYGCALVAFYLVIVVVHLL